MRYLNRQEEAIQKYPVITEHHSMITPVMNTAKRNYPKECIVLTMGQQYRETGIPAICCTSMTLFHRALIKKSVNLSSGSFTKKKK